MLSLSVHVATQAHPLFQDEAAAAGNHEDQPVYQHLVDNRAENRIEEENEDKHEDKELPHQQPQTQTQQPEAENTVSQNHTPIQIRLPLQLDFDELAGVSLYVTKIRTVATDGSDYSTTRSGIFLTEIHRISAALILIH